MVISVNKHNFVQEVEQADKPVVLEVFATWCGPCQHMAISFDKLAQELSHKYVFAKLNVDESREIAVKFHVSMVPTTIFFKNGQEVGSEIGYIAEDDLRAKINEILG